MGSSELVSITTGTSWKPLIRPDLPKDLEAAHPGHLDVQHDELRHAGGPFRARPQAQEIQGQVAVVRDLHGEGHVRLAQGP